MYAIEPKDVLSYFLGDWKIHRVISDFGEITGRARFRLNGESDQHLDYKETVMLPSFGEQKNNAFREYEYRMTDAGFDIFFSDGATKGQLFLSFASSQAMKMLPDDLPNDVESLKAFLLEQSLLLGEKESSLVKKDTQIAEWESKYQLIFEQWRLAQQKQFGKGSEVSPGQGELFDESENDSQEDRSDVDTDSQTVFYTRIKPKRKPLLKDLPRETVVVDVAESDKNWLFANTGKGARSSGILYSVIETAKANGLIPYDYLVKLFEGLSKRQSTDSLDDLLPWNVKCI
jgi:hypothetical protein